MSYRAARCCLSAVRPKGYRYSRRPRNKIKTPRVTVSPAVRFYQRSTLKLNPPYYVFILIPFTPWTNSILLLLLLSLSLSLSLSPLNVLAFWKRGSSTVSPWYNRTGWLGIKHQLTYLLTSPQYGDLKSIIFQYSLVGNIQFLTGLASHNDIIPSSLVLHTPPLRYRARLLRAHALWGAKTKRASVAEKRAVMPDGLS